MRERERERERERDHPGSVNHRARHACIGTSRTGVKTWDLIEKS